MYERTITIDIDRPYTSRIPSVQCDSGRKVKVKLTNQGKPMDLTGTRVVLACVKPDGHEIFNDTEIVDKTKGEVTFTLTEQINAEVGQVCSVLKLYDGETLVTSKGFYISVDASVGTDVALSSNELNTLTNALNEVQDIDNRFAQTNAQLSIMKTQHVNIREFGAKGDGIADDTKAIIDAISHSEKSSVKDVFIPSGVYKITSKISVPWGINLIGIYNQSTLQVEFDSDYAVELNGRHLIENIRFFYPDNDTNTTSTPKVFPASIFSNNLGYTTIRNVCLGNAYVGMHLNTINGGCMIENIYGYPLYRGIEVVHCIDVTPISRVHFNPNFFGVPNLELRKFVFENAIGLKIGRLDFCNVDKAFTWGYKSLFQLDASPKGGSANNIKFTNWIADACQFLCIFNNHDGGISFTNGTGTFYNPYEKEEQESGISPTVLTNYAVHVKGGGDGTWGGNLVSFVNNRIYRCEKHFMRATNPIIFIGNEVTRYANAYSESDSAVIDCIQLSTGAENSIIANNLIDGKNLAQNRCVSIIDVSNITLFGNTFLGYKAVDVYKNTDGNNINLNSTAKSINSPSRFQIAEKDVLSRFDGWDKNKLYLNIYSNGGVENTHFSNGVRLGGNLEVLAGSIIPTTSSQDLGNGNNRWRNGIFNGVVRTGLGSSTNRPTSVEPASFWFDASLGKPIWWTGAKWVDASGNQV